jgi:hypothetical protein
MKKLALVLAVAVLLGVLVVIPAKAAKVRAQAPEEEREGGSQEYEGRPDEIPPYPEDLMPDEDRFQAENEEAPEGASTQLEAPEASLSMPFTAKISIVLAALIIALMAVVLRKSTTPVS